MSEDRHAQTLSDPDVQLSAAVPLPSMLKSVVVIGLGNIGSVVAVLLARIARIGRITLIDRDRFDLSNLSGQDIGPEQVGHWKSRAVARRLRRLRPDLEIKAIIGDVEAVPVAQLRADAIAGCLDSRAARRYVAAAAWHLGIPYIDAGVKPDELLARVNLYPPRGDGPCYVCGWTREDYEALETIDSCSDGSLTVPATNGPASLGALAASLLVLEIQKLLGDAEGEVLVGRELLINASSGQQFVTRLWRDTDCAFDHARWDLEPVARSVSVGNLIERGESRLQGTPREKLFLAAPGQVFTRKMTCGQCGHTRERWRAVTPAGLRAGAYPCPKCAGTMMAVGHDMTDRLTGAELQPPVLRQRLSGVGLRTGDVLAVCGEDRAVHFEIGAI